jgi:hypothetical protein
MNLGKWRPRTGDWVEVRPVAEILATLNERGDLDRMPFMPEMLRFAGRRFQVTAVAHKTCDTVNRSGGRTVPRTVHLEDLRCDGSAHGGCQAACLLFWKTAWLRPADGPSPAGTNASGAASTAAAGTGVLMSNASTLRGDGTPIYRCQATTLPEWTEPLAWWDVRQYWRDVRNGNVTARHAVTMLALQAVFNLRKLPIGYRINVWLYRIAHRWLRRAPDPHPVARIPAGQPTPDERLGLVPGELVKIKSLEEIERTVTGANLNRGLHIDEEMTKYCGGQFRVATRVTQIINERTGEMMHFRNPCIVLDGVNCTGDYSDRRLLCPRRITAYWREVWLTRVDEPPASARVHSVPSGPPTFR